MQQTHLSLALAFTLTACADDGDFMSPSDTADAFDDIDALFADAPPDESTDAFVGQLADVQVITTPDEIAIAALNHAGEEIGSLRVRYDAAEDTVWTEAYYPDGAAWLGLDAAAFQEVAGSGSTLPVEVLDERAQAILALVQTRPQEGWFKCAVGAGLAVSACGAASVSGGLFLVGCAASAAGATCACISAWAKRRGKRKCADS